MPDPLHSVGEERFLLLGRTSRGRIVVVAFTERTEDIDTIRLISARLADRGERHDYEEGQAYDGFTPSSCRRRRRSVTPL